MSDLAIRSGMEKPVVHMFADAVIERLKGPYPELVGKANEIKALDSLVVAEVSDFRNHVCCSSLYLFYFIGVSS